MGRARAPLSDLKFLNLLDSKRHIMEPAVLIASSKIEEKTERVLVGSAKSKRQTKVVPRGFRSHERVKRKSPDPKAFFIKADRSRSPSSRTPTVDSDKSSPRDGGKSDMYIISYTDEKDRAIPVAPRDENEGEDAEDNTIDPSILYEDEKDPNAKFVPEALDFESTDAIGVCEHKNVSDRDGVVICEDCGVNLYDSEPQSSSAARGTISACAHENITKDKEKLICEDCGQELYEEISHEQEWRYFAESDRGSGDQSRCQYRKAVEKGIKKELEKMGFDPDIREEANKLYLLVTKGEMKKSELRKGIEFACVYWAHIAVGRPKVPEQIWHHFYNLSRRTMSQGLKFFTLNVPREYLKIGGISAKHFIPEIMTMPQFNAKQEHIDKAVNLFEQIKEKCAVLNRSNPQSASKAIVYYYLRRKGVSISPERFGKIVGLSVIILLRLTSAVSQLLGTTESVNLL
jgi:transcription initiation factor TFIIIB Brf1 subunit/transcription initiation factor TFIIB